MIEFATNPEYPFRAFDDNIRAARKNEPATPLKALASILQGPCRFRICSATARRGKNRSNFYFILGIRRKKFPNSNPKAESVPHHFNFPVIFLHFPRSIFQISLRTARGSERDFPPISGAVWKGRQRPRGFEKGANCGKVNRRDNFVRNRFHAGRGNCHGKRNLRSNFVRNRSDLAGTRVWNSVWEMKYDFEF